MIVGRRGRGRRATEVGDRIRTLPARALARMGVMARLERGERCFATFAGDRTVSFRWVGTGVVDASFLRVSLRLGDRDAWVFDSWTEPALRGRGVATQASRALGAALASEGARRTVAIVMDGNRAGKRAVSRAGYRPLGTITTIRTPHGRSVRFRRRRQE